MRLPPPPLYEGRGHVLLPLFKGEVGRGIKKGVEKFLMVILFCLVKYYFFLYPRSIMSLIVIQTGGKQYTVEPGATIKIEKLPGGLKVGDTITFDKVLLVDDGSKTTVGKPFVEGATVTATLSGEGRNKKVTVIKYRPKSRYFKKRGHRQPFIRATIN